MMQRLRSDERRNRILEILESESGPVSGNTLAKRLNVSRQVIVTDIAILRAEHKELIATNSGYVMIGSDAKRRIFKVNHPDDETEDELTGIVDIGGTILDVSVEHRVYGTIRAPLNISTRRDVNKFIGDINSGASTMLMNLTNGYHYHTVEARSVKILDEIEAMLKSKGYLIETKTSPVIYDPKRYDED